MIGRKLIYIMLILITSYITLMYEGGVPGVLLALELLLPVVLFAVSWYQKASVQVTTGSTEQVADSGEKVKIPVRVDNRGLLPVSDISLRFLVGNMLDGEEESFDMNLRVPAKGSVSVPFTFHSTYCGVVKVRLTGGKIYDYLKLFGRKKKLEASWEVVIMPHLLDLQVAVNDQLRAYDSESDEYDKHRAGDDPAEIFQVREFRQGDKMSRVHWKISARLDEMMVKELSLPVSNSVGIYLDLRYQSIDEIQSVYDLCYSLCASLLFQECRHWLIWYRPGDNAGFEAHLIKDIEDLTETVSRLMKIGRRTEGLMWREFASGTQLRLQRVLAISCMDPAKDMEDFLEPDGRDKSVLTIAQASDLIEV